MTSVCDLAAQFAELCKFFCSSLNRGRRECRVRTAPTGRDGITVTPGAQRGCEAAQRSPYNSGASYAGRWLSPPLRRTPLEPAHFVDAVVSEHGEPENRSGVRLTRRSKTSKRL